MARTVVNIKLSTNNENADKIIRQILIADEYREIDYHGEVVWKKGTGLMTAMHYIKIEYTNDAVIVSGWIQMGVGSIGGKEHALKGVVAAIPKKSVKKTISKLESALK